VGFANERGLVVAECEARLVHAELLRSIGKGAEGRIEAELAGALAARHGMAGLGRRAAAFHGASDPVAIGSPH